MEPKAHFVRRHLNKTPKETAELCKAAGYEITMDYIYNIRANSPKKGSAKAKARPAAKGEFIQALIRANPGADNEGIRQLAKAQGTSVSKNYVGVFLRDARSQKASPAKTPAKRPVIRNGNSKSVVRAARTFEDVMANPDPAGIEQLFSRLGPLYGLPNAVLYFQGKVREATHGQS